MSAEQRDPSGNRDSCVLGGRQESTGTSVGCQGLLSNLALFLGLLVTSCDN